MPPRTPSTAPTGAATSCRTGCATSSAAGADPGGQGGARGRGAGRRGRQAGPRHQGRRLAARTPAAASRSTRPACRSPSGAAQLHRSREPDHEGPRRLRPGLQRPGRGRRDAQIIWRTSLTNNAADQAPSCRCSTATAQRRRSPREVSADTGYCSEANLDDLPSARIRGYVATGRAHGKPPRWRRGQRRGPRSRPCAAAQTRRPPQPLSTAQADRRAGLRSDQAAPEASASSCCAASTRSRHEWALVCTAHNLTKLARAAVA